MASALDDVLSNINAPCFVDFSGDVTWTGDRWFDMHGGHTPSGLPRTKPVLNLTPTPNKENTRRPGSASKQTPRSARKSAAKKVARTPLRTVQGPSTPATGGKYERLYPTPPEKEPVAPPSTPIVGKKDKLQQTPQNTAAAPDSSKPKSAQRKSGAEGDSFDVIEIDFGSGEGAGADSATSPAALMRDDGKAVPVARHGSHEGPIPAWLVVEDADQPEQKSSPEPAAAPPAPANLRSTPWAQTISAAPVAKKPPAALGSRPSTARAPTASAAAKARPSRVSVQGPPKKVAAKVPRPSSAPTRPPTVRARVSERPASAGARRAVSVLRGRAGRVEEAAPRRKAASLSPLREEGRHKPRAYANAEAPHFRTESRLRGKREPSTEERELEESRRGRDAVASLKEANRRLMEKALLGDGLRANLHSTKELTRPQEPRLRTAERTAAVQAGDGRSGSAGRARPPPRREPERESEYVPMAQSVELFLTKTPPRFHSKPPTRNKPSPPPKGQMHVTVPHTPTLATDGRVGRRPAPPRSSDLAAEEARRLAASFRARPLDRRVLESRGDLGVPRVAKRPPTEAHEPCLRTAQRASTRPNDSMNESLESDRSFRARPYDAKKMAAMEMPPPPPRPALTEPQSPALFTRQRAGTRPKAEAPAPPPSFRARPVPLAEPPRLRPSGRSPTSPEPFHLATEERGAQRRAEWLDEVEAEMRREAAAREFRAREMPVASPMRVVYPDHAIELRPFTVSGDRVEHARARLAELIVDKARRIKEEAEFHARAWDRDQAEDYWTPHLDNRPPAHAEDPGLHTTERAERRRQFDACMAAKEAEIATARAELLAAKEEDERREVSELRRSMVHHAEPIRRYKPTAITRSTAPLTEPKTPQLQTNSRTRSRLTADHSFHL